MGIRWTKGADFNLLLAELNRIRTQKDGHISYKGFVFDDLAETLSSAIQFPDEIPAQQRANFLHKALFQTTQARSLSPQDVLSSVDQSTERYLRQPLASFCVRTSWSLDSVRPLFRSVRVQGAAIRFGKVPAKFTRESALRRAKETHGILDPRHYCQLLVNLRARCEYSAIEAALNASDLLRALVNYAVGYQRFRRTHIGARKPVNEVLAGPLHTIHHTDGSLVRDGVFWFDPGNRYIADKTYRTRDNHALKTSTLLLKNTLGRSPMKALAIAGLLRYVRALDHSDWHTSFFELWRALELVTCANRSSYEDTVRRASFLFANRALARERLKHLREQRNAYVHRAEQHTNPEMLVMQLKQYVEVLLRWMIANPHGFSGADELAEFLDAPDRVAEIDRKMRLLRAARKSAQTA